MFGILHATLTGLLPMNDKCWHNLVAFASPFSRIQNNPVDPKSQQGCLNGNVFPESYFPGAFAGFGGAGFGLGAAGLGRVFTFGFNVVLTLGFTASIFFG